MKSKKGLEFSFAWLFAILAGVVILFLAIYGSVKIIGSSRTTLDTASAKQLTIIFEPLETGLASGVSHGAISLKQETRIYNICKNSGNFGREDISLASASGFGNKWQDPGYAISIPNKYIFSNGTEQGKKIYYFAESFYFPWKVSEIIMLTAGKYCFDNAPQNIQDEVYGLQLENVKLGNCTNEIKVCFESGTKCDITVTGNCMNCDNEYELGQVQKNGETLYYSGSLLYAAIFSSPEIYECNIQRLMKRTIQQALLFNEEANFLTGKCDSNLGLIQFVNAARELDNSREIVALDSMMKELDNQNEAGVCQLW